MSDVKHRLFVDRSEVLIKCLPESPYRNQVEYLHKDMLEYITKLTEQLAESQRQNRELQEAIAAQILTNPKEKIEIKFSDEAQAKAMIKIVKENRELREYTSHKAWCFMYLLPSNPERRCTCGLDKAIGRESK